jgi:hypothetical protein
MRKEQGKSKEDTRRSLGWFREEIRKETVPRECLLTRSFYNRSVSWSPSTGQDRKLTRRVLLHELGSPCSASTVYDWEERRYISTGFAWQKGVLELVGESDEATMPLFSTKARRAVQYSLRQLANCTKITRHETIEAICFEVDNA